MASMAAAPITPLIPGAGPPPTRIPIVGCLMFVPLPLGLNEPRVIIGMKPAADKRNSVDQDRDWGKAAMTLSSIAIGVGRAVTSTVVRVGWFVAKYSA